MFRNTEFFSFEGEQVRAIDVYFGASYREGAFVPQVWHTPPKPD
jgi:hypothetical protein